MFNTRLAPHENKKTGKFTQSQNAYKFQNEKERPYMNPQWSPQDVLVLENVPNKYIESTQIRLYTPTDVHIYTKKMSK